MRIEHRREFYIPKGATLQDADGTDAAVYFFANAIDKPCAIGFAGKAQKPAFHHLYPSEEARQKHVAGFIQGRRGVAAYRASVRAERTKPHTLTVGAILVSSWGHEQTNVNFYKVVKVVGPHTVELVAIGLATVPDKSTGNSMADYVLPAPDHVSGEPMRRRANASNGVRIDDVSSAHVWEGRPQYRSWYA